MPDDRPPDRREFFPFGAVMDRDGQICVSLEHRGGMAVDVIEPYLKRGNAMEYGSLIARPGRKTVFGA